VLGVLERYVPRRVVLDGCQYTEQLQAVGIEGGVAGNVVPDRAALTINYRFAPDRDAASTEQALRDMFATTLDLSEGDALDVTDASPGAMPALGHPVLASLVAATGQPPRAKLGWTDVATFAELGVPATNFGPGDPLLAHTRDEHVSRRELERVRDVLATVLLAD
jgi:succinyl-diaminopimelate desuccinylase